MDKRAFRDAQLAAAQELELIATRFRKAGWKETIGSSGTAKALGTILQENGQAQAGNTAGEITREGLEWLRDKVLKSGGFAGLSIAGMKTDRIPVLAGGLAIMLTVFEILDIRQMSLADTALRDGVLNDLLGRAHHKDIRDATVEAMARRYHVDHTQSARVRQLALAFFDGLNAAENDSPDEEFAFQRRQRLLWAARLHEIGIDIAQANFHKHSAYVIGNADMPGFSKREQAVLASLVIAQRGRLSKVTTDLPTHPSFATKVVCLRLAVLLCRSRRDIDRRLFSLVRINGEFRLSVKSDWLSAHNLTQYELEQEMTEWGGLGMKLEIVLA